MWRNHSATGLMGVMLMSKMKDLKMVLKNWSKVENGNMSVIFVKLMRDIGELDVMG